MAVVKYGLARPILRPFSNFADRPQKRDSALWYDAEASGDAQKARRPAQIRRAGRLGEEFQMLFSLVPYAIQYRWARMVPQVPIAIWFG